MTSQASLTSPTVVPTNAGTQYSGACVVTLERICWVSDYWVPAYAGTTERGAA